MLNTKYRWSYSHILFLYLALYFIINICTLKVFPYVHSDEPWLGGLSRAMLESGDISVTEPFFDTLDRTPHGIRTIFHLIQALFIQIFGYHIFSLRLVSLFFSMGCLYIFYSLCRRVFGSEKIALTTTILLSLDIHFIYTSHLARQEIIILFVLLLSMNWLLWELGSHSDKRDIKIGILIGLSIGIHPNSFIAALTIGGAYLLLVLLKELNFKNLARLIMMVTIFALFFVAISLYMDGNFFENYQARGTQFGVNRSFLEKVKAVGNFYKNIYLGRSVTYYIPNIKFQLWFFSLSYILSFILLFKSRRSRQKISLQCTFLAVILINLGFMMIGRYNVTSIIFLFPFLYILAGYCLISIGKNRDTLLILFIAFTIFHTWNSMPSYNNTYDDYLGKLSPYVPKNAPTLSNLNTEYYFENGALLDYRNLALIKNKGMNFEEYLTTNNIEYIIYYEEMDYINRVNPVYNGVYGDVSSYYEELQNFLNEKCHRIHRFTDSTYGTNITRLIDDRDWQISIYKVKNQG